MVMMRTILTGLMLVALALPLRADDATAQGAPRGWQFGGDAASYAVGTEVLPRMAAGTQVAFLKAGASADCGTYGALFQTISAEAYRGRKVRLSARVLTDGLTPRLMQESSKGGFDLFLFVQSPTGKQFIYRGKDYAPGDHGHRVQEWERRVTVVEVPEDAQQIVFGFRLSGPRAAAWIDQVRFDAVSADAAVPPSGVLAWRNREYSMYQSLQCPARRGFLAERGLVDRDERDVLVKHAQTVSPVVVAAMTR